MKVVAFMGSPKKEGNTATLLNQFLNGIKESGENVDVKNIYLKENKISPCMACNYCKREGKCIQNDDMQNLYEVFKEADFLVFATPIYWWSMSAQLKTFIDRTYALREKDRKGKKAYLIMTYGGEAPNLGPELTKKTFEEIFDYVGIEYLGSYGVCTDDYMPVKENTKALEEIYTIGKNIIK